MGGWGQAQRVAWRKALWWERRRVGKGRVFGRRGIADMEEQRPREGLSGA